MNLSLFRHYFDDCTLGKLHVGGVVFSTIERPQTYEHPCIPQGTYSLVPHVSPEHGDVYAFVGGTCYEYAVPEGKEGRCLIELHPANFASQLLGCIAPGLADGFMDEKRAVFHSRAAMAALREILGKETHSILIMRGT